MKQNLTLAAKIKGLKPGKSFIVEDKKARREALNIARVLKNSGAIDFYITTRKSRVIPGKFTVGIF